MAVAAITQKLLPSLSYLGTDLGPDASIWLSRNDPHTQLYGHQTQKLTHCYIGNIAGVFNEDYLAHVVRQLVEHVDKSPHAAICISYDDDLAIHVPVRWIRMCIPGVSSAQEPRMEVIFPVQKLEFVECWMSEEQQLRIRQIDVLGTPLTGFLTTPVRIEALEFELRFRRVLYYLSLPGFTVVYRAVHQPQRT